MNREDLSNSNRIVVKIGSSLLDTSNPSLLRELIEQIKELREADREIVLVSSGAIFFGLETLQPDNDPVTLPQKQATAAIGQPLLMNFYEELFGEQDLLTGQILLTQSGIHDRQSYLNASNTLNTLLDMGVIPIVNENDTVATEEIQFGDNDTLSVLVTTLIDADLLIILSDVEGLYPGDPENYEEPISTVEEITEETKELAGPAEENTSTVGGMQTKVEAAETAANSGTPMIVASGYTDSVLTQIVSGAEIGTLFKPRQGEDVIKGRKRWIGYHLLPKGYVQVDGGAAAAIKERGKSLLPSGIERAVGQFERGDVVKIIDNEDAEFGRGMINYNQHEVTKLKGCQSSEISDILGTHYYDEIIHRDNLVVFPDDYSSSERN